MNNYIYLLAIIFTMVQFVMPTYLFSRLFFIVKPIGVNYYFEETLNFYIGLNRGRLKILTVLWLISLALGKFITINLIESPNIWQTSLNIISIALCQLFIIILFENKTPKHIISIFCYYIKCPKELFKLYVPQFRTKVSEYKIHKDEIISIINEKFDVNSELIYNSTSALADKVNLEILPKLDKNQFLIKENTSAIYNSFNTQVELQKLIDTHSVLTDKVNLEILPKLDKNQLLIQENIVAVYNSVNTQVELQKLIDRQVGIIQSPNKNIPQPRNTNYTKEDLLDICNKNEISLNSLKDVEYIVTGKKIRNKIIFTGVHNKLYSKKLVAQFFKEHFFIYNEDGKLNSNLNQEGVLNFINTNIEFKSDRELKKDQKLVVTKSDLSKK